MGVCAKSNSNDGECRLMPRKHMGVGAECHGNAGNAG